MKEVRWHARAGQGAKTAAHLLALAAVRDGRSVQAFPEYGPERRGAPIRAYTRFDDRPIRRRYAITEPDASVVLDPSLVTDPSVVAGLGPRAVLVVNGEREPAEVAELVGFDGEVVCVPAVEIAAAGGSGFVNVVMLGAVAGALGEPPLEALAGAVEEGLGRKLDADGLAAARVALEAGHRAAAREPAWAA